MILIAHRGNINGRFESYENEPTYLDMAIKAGYDVEIDVWEKNNMLFLGHDEPQYSLDMKWLRNNISRLWIHCKNIDALLHFTNTDYPFNYFWHETDTVTLTSKNYIWAYPNKQPIKNSIAVMPELHLSLIHI